MNARRCPCTTEGTVSILTVRWPLLHPLLPLPSSDCPSHSSTIITCSLFLFKNNFISFLPPSLFFFFHSSPLHFPRIRQSIFRLFNLHLCPVCRSLPIIHHSSRRCFPSFKKCAPPPLRSPFHFSTSLPKGTSAPALPGKTPAVVVVVVAVADWRLVDRMLSHSVVTMTVRSWVERRTIEIAASHKKSDAMQWIRFCWHLCWLRFLTHAACSDCSRMIDNSFPLVCLPCPQFLSYALACDGAISCDVMRSNM